MEKLSRETAERQIGNRLRTGRTVQRILAGSAIALGVWAGLTQEENFASSILLPFGTGALAAVNYKTTRRDCDDIVRQYGAVTAISRAPDDTWPHLLTPANLAYGSLLVGNLVSDGWTEVDMGFIVWGGITAVVGPMLQVAIEKTRHELAEHYQAQLTAVDTGLA